MKLLVGTNNTGKVVEIREVFSNLPFTLLTPEHLEIEEVPEENGISFAENAIAKAQFYYNRAKLPTVADDSGILVEAFEEELGIHTRRWGPGAEATDEEWIGFFLDRMKKEQNKRARFVCSLAYIDDTGRLTTFEGTCEGTITDSLEAPYLPGLPISGCFRPDGYEQVFSALPIEHKNSTSHRGRALQQFLTYITDETNLADLSTHR
ncbi:MAG: non-canonical purine NTP pyrophosphatase [Candidatus Peregrinibacteria bacterium]|nr:non-canonical purine NTP pyrophosphatase [Candidatus Peregrinibacteria bacterium]